MIKSHSPSFGGSGNPSALPIVTTATTESARRRRAVIRMMRGSGRLDQSGSLSSILRNLLEKIPVTSRDAHTFTTEIHAPPPTIPQSPVQTALTNRALKYSIGRSPFNELQCPQSSCKLSRWFVPPFDRAMM